MLSQESVGSVLIPVELTIAPEDGSRIISELIWVMGENAEDSKGKEEKAEENEAREGKGDPLKRIRQGDVGMGSQNLVDIEEREENELEHRLEKGSEEGAPFETRADITGLPYPGIPTEELEGEEAVKKQQAELQSNKKKQGATVIEQRRGGEI